MRPRLRREFEGASRRVEVVPRLLALPGCSWKWFQGVVPRRERSCSPGCRSREFRVGSLSKCMVSWKSAPELAVVVARRRWSWLPVGRVPRQRRSFLRTVEDGRCAAREFLEVCRAREGRPKWVAVEDRSGCQSRCQQWVGDRWRQFVHSSGGPELRLAAMGVSQPQRWWCDVTTGRSGTGLWCWRASFRLRSGGMAAPALVWTISFNLSRMGVSQPQPFETVRSCGKDEPVPVALVQEGVVAAELKMLCRLSSWSGALHAPSPTLGDEKARRIERKGSGLGVQKSRRAAAPRRCLPKSELAVVPSAMVVPSRLSR